MSTTPTKVLVSGDTYRIFKHDGIRNELPLGVYQINFGQTGPYLTKIEDIELPEKVYSNDTNFINHVMTSWNDLEQGLLGIGLVGGKGLGKSLTCNLIAKKTNLPVIKLTQMVGDTGFLDYIKQLEQDFVFYIDEFEKLFPRSFNGDDGRASQEQILSFLDGGTIKNNKIMFLITANDDSSINDFLKNRPSRLRYYKKYELLEDRVIREVVDDLLLNKDHLDNLLSTLPYKDINLDSLIKIIQEMNLHNQPYSSFKDFFNFQPTSWINFDISVRLPDGNLELIKSGWNRSLSSYNTIGYSRKLVEGRSTAIISGPDFQIYEQPNEPIELAGFYYSNEVDPESGDRVEKEVILLISPSELMVSSKYKDKLDLTM